MGLGVQECNCYSGLIKFDEPFLDFHTRCNSKTYYYLLISTQMDIPLLVHNYQYKKYLLSECKCRFNVKYAPIFYINDYYKQIIGTKYKKMKFIIDDPIVFDVYSLPMLGITGNVRACVKNF